MTTLLHAGIDDPMRVRSDLVIFRLAANVVIPAQYLYTFSFNHIPDDIRLAAAGGLAVAYALLSVTAAVVRPSGWSALVLISAFITILCLAVSHIFAFGNFDLRIVSKGILPYLAVIWVLSYPEAMPHRALGFWAVVSIVVGATLAFTGDPVTLGGKTRLATFTGTTSAGGTIDLHPSAYFIAVNVLVVDQLRRWQAVRPEFAWAIIGLGTVVLLFYQVRTTWLMLALYGLGSLYFRYRHIELVRAYAFAAIGLAFVGVFAFFELTTMETGRLGSGRIAAYVHRLDLIGSRDLLTFMFGSGAGSDKFTTGVWLSAKGSHNDFLQTLVQRGLVGFAGLILFIVALGLRLSGGSKALLIALIATSAVSNGLLGRPAQIPYLFFAMGLALALHSGHREGSASVRQLAPWIPGSSR